MTAHAQKAIDWIDYSSNLNPDADNKALHTAQLAQVHATLELAEQQRIANLIALSESGRTTVNGARAALKGIYDSAGENGTVNMNVRPEIAAALGITEGKS